MSKHTKGPWFYYDRNNSEQHKASGFRFTIGQDWNVKNGRTVAYALGQHTADEANARLIAAAPNLLALLTTAEGALACLLEGDTVDRHDYAVAERDLAEIRAALAALGIKTEANAVLAVGEAG